MQRFLKIMIAFLMVFFLFIGGFTVHLITEIRTCGTLINYVGIVRGATQRLVKLELSGKPNDQMRTYLDGIMLELCGGEGQYDLPYPEDDAYRKCLSRLTLHWEQLKHQIDNVRAGGDPHELLASSELYFKLANDTVFAASEYSDAQTWEATWLILIIVAITASTWLGILIFNIRRMRKLEKDNLGLSNIAYRDKLTGAPNLDKFKIDAQDLLLRFHNLKFTVIYVDFENFKVINDVFGYEYGDLILQQYARILIKDMGKYDTFCRISSDNFLILRSYTDKELLTEQQKAIDLQISQFAIASAQEQYFIRISGGFCCLEDLTRELEIADIIERANFARKAAKLQSTQNYVFYNESLRQKMLSEQAIENRMHEALKNGEFHVYFQPKVSLETGKIACAEALSRWIEKDGNIISPAEFIPIFEKNLFIIKLDQHVLRQVCRWLCERLDNNLPLVPVSVNVSRMQLYDPAFVTTYAQIKEEYRIPDFLLQVEFTESVVFEDMELLVEIINQLKHNGFYCSLDDFGKGYSSLNLLKNLPVDELKLDGLFFEKTNDVDRARIVVTSIADLAKQLKIQIVAEGVEVPRQIAFLREIGCNLVQGFVFYHPMPDTDFGALLEQSPTSAI
ncbi:MAG: bifunctional diguanylate cyclase/phosphodiesterase [Anaerovoracaceae bacterium]